MINAEMINLIKPKIELIYAPPKKEAYRILRIAASNCYQSNVYSERAMLANAAETLIKKIIKNKHHSRSASEPSSSVLEHVQITFKVTCDRAVSHEWVRHRIGVAYSQESQRYCAYRDSLDIIKPRWFDNATLEKKDEFTGTVLTTYKYYRTMIKKKELCPRSVASKALPQDARAVLPNATATRIVVSMNLRSILHFLELRLSEKAHPDIRIMAEKLKQIVIGLYPVMEAALE